jgi:hypothetical protein
LKLRIIQKSHKYHMSNFYSKIYQVLNFRGIIIKYSIGIQKILISGNVLLKIYVSFKPF